MTEWGFSIDLQAELAKLTQRQYLNDVHFLIQLVRHGLMFSPQNIDIQGTRKDLYFSHDGAPIGDEEWRLLQMLLMRDQGAHAEAVQDALTRMEENYGIALLSLFLNHPRVTLTSGNRSLSGGNGAARASRSDRSIQGYEVSLERNRPAVIRNERHELSYFCVGVKVSLLYNGEPLNGRITLDKQMFLSEFQAPEGEGAVGIPAEDDLCFITFFKQGVRIGTRHFFSPDGKLFHGYFNTHSAVYEPNFKASIEVGERLMNERAGTLLTSLPGYFDQFSARQRMRIKKILFGLDERWWTSHFNRLPLFETAWENRMLTLDDLTALADQFEAIPYSSGKDRSLPPGIPVLQPEEIAFLEEDLELNLTLCLTRGEPEPAPPPRRFEIYPASKLDPVRRGFLDALNRQDLFTRYHFTENRSGVQADAEGKRAVYLELSHPMVNEALDRFHAQPQAAAMLGYRLAALARDTNA
ncbi:MAG: hypothetical protein QNK37_23450 [Acidobacteriota bacterium]|nr:hypothetical protein [Acidobacteriota bacterium]